MSQSKACDICSNVSHPQAKYCQRCRNLIKRGAKKNRFQKKALEQALRQAWDGWVFRCHYSGAQVIEDDSKDPRYLTFDHRIPRRDDDAVVAAALLNDMKTDMSEDEFRKVVIELAQRFAGGGFDDRIMDLKYWKR